jgi:enoyl-CoA hydratase
MTPPDRATIASFSSEVLTIEVDSHVAILWLDRAAKRNALGPDFWSDLPGAMEAIGSDPEVRVVVVAARGPHFTVGLDLVAMAGLTGPSGSGDGAALSMAARAHSARKEILRLQSSVTAVADCPLPVIAAVHGYCIGGGVDLIAACDIRLASADALFSVRETKIAIVADLGSLQRLPHIIGKGHVAELAYTGSVVADARDMAAEIAANSPLAVQGTKAVLTAGEGRSVGEGLEYVAAWNAGALASDDLTEAVAAFMEKRPAVFTGR